MSEPDRQPFEGWTPQECTLFAAYVFAFRMACQIIADNSPTTTYEQIFQNILTDGFDYVINTHPDVVGVALDDLTPLVNGESTHDPG